MIRKITLFLVVALGITSSQTTTQTLDSYLSTAKAAAGTDWAGTFLRLCIPPSSGLSAGGGAGRGTPTRESWYAEPAKVADNLYFLGTRIHRAWAIAGSEGIIVIEALFDYAAKDEILDGLKKVGLDPSEFTRKYDPSNPAADKSGYVKLPNVNALIEMNDMREAQRSYEANLKVIEVSRGMLQRTIDLLR